MGFSRQGYWSGLPSPGVTPVLDEHGGRSLLLQMEKLPPRGKNQFARVKGLSGGTAGDWKAEPVSPDTSLPPPPVQKLLQGLHSAWL